jgi:hypothetical protein
MCGLLVLLLGTTLIGVGGGMIWEVQRFFTLSQHYSVLAHAPRLLQGTADVPDSDVLLVGPLGCKGLALEASVLTL